MDSSEEIPRSMPISRAEVDHDLVKAVAVLFRTFARAFGTKWRATFEDPAAPAVWERKFASVGLSAAAVRSGMGPATDLEFPPSLGEFIALCKPPAPAALAALEEAMRWIPDCEFAWSHPAIGAAAREIRYWRLHGHDDQALRRLWEGIYAQMLDRHARGERLDVPTVRALPSEIRITTPPGAPPPDRASVAIAEAARLLGISLG